MSGCEEIADGCEIEANCSFGQFNLLVPKHCRVKTDASTAFGNLNIVGQPDNDYGATIELDGSASFGEICVKYI